MTLRARQNYQKTHIHLPKKAVHQVGDTRYIRVFLIQLKVFFNTWYCLRTKKHYVTNRVRTCEGEPNPKG